MKLGKLGTQIVFKSEKAFQRIRFVNADRVSASVYYEKKTVRDLEARRAYRNTKRSKDNINELFILDIMREGITNGDPRLR